LAVVLAAEALVYQLVAASRLVAVYPSAPVYLLEAA
jgi:hypothetical protein